MPNAIKYSTTGDTLSLKKGNIFFGVGDVGKGPSSATTYYNGVTPPSGGYTIYSYNAAQTSKLSFHTAVNDSALITYTNGVSGQNFSTATQCLNWYVTQSNYVCVNRDYEGIVTNGLVLNLDAGFTPSYTSSGTTWYDLSYNGYNGTLTNGPSFNSDNGGSIVFDGTNDYMTTSSVVEAATSSNLQTLCSWVYGTGTNNSFFGSDANSTGKFHIILNYQSNGQLRFAESYYGGGGGVQDQTNVVTVSSNVTWNFACIVKTASGIYDVYYNGTKVINGATKAATLSSNLALGIWWTGQYVPSRTSILYTYNRALTASEILQNYNAQKSRFGL